MDSTYGIILGVFLILCVLYFIILALLKSEKTSFFSRFTKGVKNLFSDQPSIIPEADERGNTMITHENNVCNIAEDFWTVKAIDVKNGGILGEGSFDKAFFDTDTYAYREKHYTIGRESGENYLIIGGTYTAVSEKHAYIRYNRNDGEYYYWDNNSSNGTYINNGTENVRLPGNNVKITNGLELYIGYDVRLVFEKVEAKDNQDIGD